MFMCWYSVRSLVVRVTRSVGKEEEHFVVCPTQCTVADKCVTANKPLLSWLYIYARS